MGDLVKVNFSQHHKKAKTSNLKEKMGKVVDKAIPIVIGGLLIAEVIIVSHFLGDAVVESFSEDNPNPGSGYSEQVETDTPDYKIVMNEDNSQVEDEYQDDLTNDEGGFSR